MSSQELALCIRTLQARWEDECYQRICASIITPSDRNSAGNGGAHISTISSQIFDGMQYLESQSLCYMSTATSKVLLAHDGTVNLSYIEDCKDAGFASARTLGMLIIAMMQKGVIHIDSSREEKLGLRSPLDWLAASWM